ncbi:MAG: DUF4127 family protein [Armatimonadetes bacterium]|nr:DUF4127 family protein [Armatimonadota bacterium]
MTKMLTGCLCFLLLAVAGCAGPSSAPAKSGPDQERMLNILFVPGDARPITDQYPREVGRRQNIQLIMPPAEYSGRGNGDDSGRYEDLARFIEEKMPLADGVILSTDTFIYGGLLASRNHHLAPGELQERLAGLRSLFQDNPGPRPKIYAYTSLMRLPKQGGSREEPPYYEEYGALIYRLSVLEHKKKLGLLTGAQEKETGQLIRAIPAPYLGDYLSRRQKNLSVTKAIIADNPFDYWVLCRDDTAEYGYPRLEYQELQQLPGAKFTSLTGADETGLLLLARMINDLRGRKPKVFVDYADPQAVNRIPPYEDTPLAQTVREHLAAAGGEAAERTGDADIVLMVNNAPTKSTEAAGKENEPFRPESCLAAFVQRAATYLQQGKTVAVADVAFANGADNKLIRLLLEENLYFRLESYAGWNTAANALGSALAEAMLSGDKKRCLLIRLIDDWAYQANVRQEIKQTVLGRGLDPAHLQGEEKEAVAGVIEEKLNAFLRAHGITGAVVTGVNLPKNRTFEISFGLSIN